MSRCFPFPPPGYEKKPGSSEHGDLLAKEKQKEKKHKKEKKDKDRKDKDKSKDKHREKKERKEKHRDKKKDKERNKEKNKTPVDRKNEIHREVKLGYDSHETEEVRDSKFTEELGRRIREEQVTTNHMVEDISATASRRIEIAGTSTAMVNKVLTNVTGAIPRNEKLIPSFHKRTDSMEIATTTDKHKAKSSEKNHDFTSAERRSNEHLTPQVQKRIETMGNAASMEKQRVTINQKVDDFTILVERRPENIFTANSVQKERMASNNLASKTIGPSTKRNDQAEENQGHATAMEKQRATNNHKIGETTNPVERRLESIFTVNSVQKERITSSNLPLNATAASTKRNDQAAENHYSIPRRIESISGVPATEKERFMFPNSIGTKQGRAEGMGLPVAKGTDKKTDGKEESKEKKAEDGKREGHKDRERNEKKRKEKDRDRDKHKKKEEKERGKGEHKRSKHDKVKVSEIKDQIHDLNHKTLDPHMETINAAGTDLPNKESKEDSAGTDGPNQKRKELEMNGFHESQHDGPPNKQPRTSIAASHPLVDNGRPLQSAGRPVESASVCSPIKLVGIDYKKVERGLDNNVRHVNGKVEAQPSTVLKPPIPAVIDSSKSDRVPSRPPHPDTKYLSIIYTVPKMEDLSEFDDQDWLFNGKKSPSNTKVEADGTPPQVGPKGLRIEAADVVALPYIIPF